MRKIFLGSIVLTLFAITTSVIQVSCNRDVIAQNSSYVLPPATTSRLGGVIVGGGLSITSDGVLSTSGSSINKILYVVKQMSSTATTVYQMWIANYDGSNKVRIGITLPRNIVVRDDMNPRLSPDGKKIFFLAYNTDWITPRTSLWSCNIDGSNVSQIIVGDTNENIIFGGAY
jgi:hypothetical protein